MTILLSLFVIISFFLGVALLFQGYFNLPTADQTASRPELEQKEMELAKARGESEQLKSQLNALALNLDEANGKLSWAQDKIKTMETAVAQTSAAGERIKHLEQDLDFLSQKADSQAREAVELINRLASENEQFKNTATPAPDPQEITALKDENQKLTIQLEGYAGKLKELEAKLAESSAQMSAAPAVNTEELQAKVRAAEEEVHKIRQQSEEKIIAANAAITKLNSTLDALNATLAQKDEKIKSLGEELLAKPATPAIDPAWVSQKAQLEQSLKDSQKMMAMLKEREKVLTFKLAQSRAHAMGLEKLCEELRGAAR